MTECSLPLAFGLPKPHLSGYVVRRPAAATPSPGGTKRELLHGWLELARPTCGLRRSTMTCHVIT